MFANALQVPLRAVKIHPLPFNTIPPKRQVSIKLLLASQAYETPAVIAAFLTEKQNTSDATGNCCYIIVVDSMLSETPGARKSALL